MANQLCLLWISLAMVVTGWSLAVLAETPPSPTPVYTSKDLSFLRRVNQAMTQAPYAVRQELIATPYETQIKAGKAACQYLDSGFLGAAGMPTQAGEEASESTEQASKTQYVLGLYFSIAGINTYCPSQLEKP